MERNIVERSARHALALGLAAVLAACGTGAGPTTPPSTANASANTPATPVATVTPTTPPPTPVVITPPTMAEAAPLKELWTYSGPPASFAWAPAMDPDGRIWVAALSLGAFWVLDREGKLSETWGEAGKGDGQLAIKADSAKFLGHVFGSIAFAPDGSFVVGDGGNRRVQVFDANRKFVRAFGTFGTGDGEFANIAGIAVAPDGSIIVTDGDRLDIQVFDTSGAHLRTLQCAGGGEEASPIVAVDASGALWCLDGDQLRVWGADGQRTFDVHLAGIITLGIGLAIAPNGHVFVASVDPAKSRDEAPERLLELDAKGTLLHVWPNGGEGIAIDPAGDRLYISSVDLKRVRAYALPAH